MTYLSAIRTMVVALTLASTGWPGPPLLAFTPPPCNNLAGLASVSRLERGNLISNRPFLHFASGILASANVCFGTATGWAGQFDGEGIGYIGFKFNNGSGDQY